MGLSFCNALYLQYLGYIVYTRGLESYKMGGKWSQVYPSLRRIRALCRSLIFLLVFVLILLANGGSGQHAGWTGKDVK